MPIECLQSFQAKQNLAHFGLSVRSFAYSKRCVDHPGVYDCISVFLEEFEHAIPKHFFNLRLIVGLNSYEASANCDNRDDPLYSINASAHLQAKTLRYPRHVSEHPVYNGLNVIVSDCYRADFL
jgi:hypothetical protein